MKEPDADLTAGREERAEAPAFDALVPPEELVRGGRTRDDFLDAVLGLDEPATVGEVATLAGHGRDAAREYLAWFARMGIVERVSDSPVTYRCNREYLSWRRVQRLREEYEPEELVDRLEAAAERDREFAERFDADRPEQVRIADRAAATGASVEEVWEQVSAWRTTRRRVALLEEALATGDDGPGGRQRRIA